MTTWVTDWINVSRLFCSRSSIEMKPHGKTWEKCNWRVTEFFFLSCHLLSVSLQIIWITCWCPWRDFTKQFCSNSHTKKKNNQIFFPPLASDLLTAFFNALAQIRRWCFLQTGFSASISNQLKQIMDWTFNEMRSCANKADEWRPVYSSCMCCEMSVYENDSSFRFEQSLSKRPFLILQF